MRILNEASLWTIGRCDFLTLWHGCTNVDREGIEAAGIDLGSSRLDLDFGRGFYTTTLERQARHWAVRRYDSTWVRKQNNGPVVLRFRVPRVSLSKLSLLNFVLGNYENEDYWSLVQHCRQSRAPNKITKKGAVIRDHRGPVNESGHRWFDIVSGPVVADWKQRAALQDMDQFSFHTMAAVELLNGLIGSGDLENYSWQQVHV